jgi:dTDP-glucose 4,6-dehydratase
MKYAISGSSGFVGRHLLQRLGQVELLERDGIIRKGTNVVFDLAAYGNMAGQTPDPRSIYEANLLRVATSLQEIIGTRTKFIYMSTSSVSLPTQTFYSASKKATEEMIQIAVRDWGIKACIIRPYTIIGQGEQKEHLIPTLINSCLWDKEMPFVERPVHDFVDVEDVVDALILIAEKGKFQGEVYEVGTGQQLTNRYIRQVIERTLKCKANIKLVKSLRKYDTKKWKADNRSLRALGWKPKMKLGETIRNMVQDYLPL